MQITVRAHQKNPLRVDLTPRAALLVTSRSVRELRSLGNRVWNLKKPKVEGPDGWSGSVEEQG